MDVFLWPYNVAPSCLAGEVPFFYLDTFGLACKDKRSGDFVTIGLISPNFVSKDAQDFKEKIMKWHHKYLSITK